MKQLFTLFTLLCTIPFFAQIQFDHLPEDVQQLLEFEKQQPSNQDQANLRNPFGLDSAYQYIYPSEEVNIKKYYTTNDLGSVMTELTIKYNSSTNIWENNSKLETTRDANDQISETIFWDFNGVDWELDQKYSFTYDAQGNRLEFIIQNWSSTNEIFFNKTRYIDTYDSDDKITQSDHFVWNNGDWIPATRTLFMYDVDGLLVESIAQDYSELSGIYTDYLKAAYAYDNNGYLKKRVTATYDWNFLTWDSLSRFEYFNDNNGNRVAQYYSTWDENLATPDWVNNEYIQYTFDGNENRVEDFHQTYDTNSSTWNDTRKWVYFFSIVTSTETPLAATVSCFFQNPMQTGQVIRCQDLENFEVYGISLFDISGRVLLEKTFIGEGEIQLPKQMEGGVYFMNVMLDGKLVWREKIVVME